MNDLVLTNSSGKEVTTSLIIAEVFKKRHTHVLRDIESMSCSQEFNQSNFGLIEYIDSMGRAQPAYEITKDGFALLVMGYKGERAGEFKERFINEFNKREAMLKDDDYIISRAMMLLSDRNKALERKLNQASEQLKLQDAVIKEAVPKANLMNRVLETNGLINIGQVAKVLQLPYGRNRLFQKLKELGILFSMKGRNEPKQQYIDSGYFVLKETYKELPSGEKLVFLTPFATQRGMAFIAHKLGVTIPKRKSMLFD